jgi:hypothetical protein
MAAVNKNATTWQVFLDAQGSIPHSPNPKKEVPISSLTAAKNKFYDFKHIKGLKKFLAPHIAL